MLERLKSNDIGAVDLIPRAVVRRSVQAFRDQSGICFEAGEDDLDCYDAAFLALDGVAFALMHHRGEPPDVVSVYLPRHLHPRALARAVGNIMDALGIPPDHLVWQDAEAPHRVSA